MEVISSVRLACPGRIRPFQRNEEAASANAEAAHRNVVDSWIARPPQAINASGRGRLLALSVISRRPEIQSLSEQSGHQLIVRPAASVANNPRATSAAQSPSPGFHLVQPLDEIGEGARAA
jgi:hypothetical protein